jgi:hypothetical protein
MCNFYKVSQYALLSRLSGLHLSLTAKRSLSDIPSFPWRHSTKIFGKTVHKLTNNARHVASRRKHGVYRQALGNVVGKHLN